MKLKNIALGGMFWVFFSTQLQAGSELETLIKMLHANGTVSEAQYGRLMDEIRAGSEKATLEKESYAQEKKEIQTMLDETRKVEFQIDKGGIQLKSRDGDFETKIGGRIQADAAWYDEDSSSSSSSSLGNGAEIRRARLYIQGKMFYDWGYKLQYDFTGSGKKGIKDAFLSYKGFKHFEIKGGHFKEPFMLQEQTSSKYITFTERALLDAFSAGRSLGLMASTAHQHWTASAGLFADSVSTTLVGKDESWGVAGRLTYAPVNENNKVIHFGFSGNYRDLGDVDALRFKQQAETHITGNNFVDTGTIDYVENVLKLGFEIATVFGPFSAQSEFIHTRVERYSGRDLDFDGWYVEASYFLTGESRHYKKGKFGSVSPVKSVGYGGVGAWQLATRFSTLDLNDADINGGEADSVTIGLNWFPVSTLRFSGNYVKVLDVDGGEHSGDEPSLFQVRGQWAF